MSDAPSDDGSNDRSDGGGDCRSDGEEFVVPGATDLAPGERVVVELAGVEVGVFRIEDGYRAYPNWCPHQGGPVCEGTAGGTVEASFDRETLETTTEWVREGEVLNCPWHGWEFDLDDGACLSGRAARLPAYEVRVEDGDVVVSL